MRLQLPGGKEGGCQGPAEGLWQTRLSTNNNCTVMLDLRKNKDTHKLTAVNCHTYQLAAVWDHKWQGLADRRGHSWAYICLVGKRVGAKALQKGFGRPGSAAPLATAGTTH